MVICPRGPEVPFGPLFRVKHGEALHTSSGAAFMRRTASCCVAGARGGPSARTGRSPQRSRHTARPVIRPADVLCGPVMRQDGILG